MRTVSYERGTAVALLQNPAAARLIHARGDDVQGYLAYKKQPPRLGPVQGPGHRPTVGFYGGGGLMRGVPLYRHGHPRASIGSDCVTPESVAVQDKGAALAA